MLAYLTIVHALSSLHAGTGQGSGIIDLPIAREKATGLPYLPGSSLKGALRTSCESVKVNVNSGGEQTISREQIFGSENSNGEVNTAGTVQISDQRLLLLPVRSLAGTFAWVTSPYVLRRLARDLADLALLEEQFPVPEIASDAQACIVSDERSSCQLLVEEDRIYLEDLDLQARNEGVALWANWLGESIFPREETWKGFLRERLCVVHDTLFSFLLETATEITARIRLDEGSKTVRKGGLWYEESLPAETVLSGLALTTPRAAKTNGMGNGKKELSDAEIGAALEKMGQKNVQLGGKSTVGRGQCRIHLLEGGRTNHAHA